MVFAKFIMWNCSSDKIHLTFTSFKLVHWAMVMFNSAIGGLYLVYGMIAMLKCPSLQDSCNLNVFLNYSVMFSWFDSVLRYFQGLWSIFGVFCICPSQGWTQLLENALWSDNCRFNSSQLRKKKERLFNTIMLLNVFQVIVHLNLTAYPSQARFIGHCQCLVRFCIKQYVSCICALNECKVYRLVG